MGVHVERLAVLRLDLDRGGRRRPRGQATQKHPRQPAVRRERVEVGIAEIVEQRAVGVDRIGSARHQHADREKVDDRHRAGRRVVHRVRGGRVLYRPRHFDRARHLAQKIARVAGLRAFDQRAADFVERVLLHRRQRARGLGRRRGPQRHDIGVRKFGLPGRRRLRLGFHFDRLRLRDFRRGVGHGGRRRLRQAQHAKALKTRETAFGVVNRQRAERRRDAAGGVLDRPVDHDAAPRLARRESGREGGAQPHLLGRLLHAAPEQIGVSRADDIAQHMRHVDETAGGVGLPEESRSGFSMPFVEPRAQLGERRIGGRLLRLDFGGVRRRLSGSRVVGAQAERGDGEAGRVVALEQAAAKNGDGLDAGADVDRQALQPRRAGAAQPVDRRREPALAAGQQPGGRVGPEYRRRRRVSVNDARRRPHHRENRRARGLERGEGGIGGDQRRRGVTLVLEHLGLACLVDALTKPPRWTPGKRPPSRQRRSRLTGT